MFSKHRVLFIKSSIINHESWIMNHESWNQRSWFMIHDSWVMNHESWMDLTNISLNVSKSYGVAIDKIQKKNGQIERQKWEIKIWKNSTTKDSIVLIWILTLKTCQFVSNRSLFIRNKRFPKNSIIDSKTKPITKWNEKWEMRNKNPESRIQNPESRIENSVFRINKAELRIEQINSYRGEFHVLKHFSFSYDLIEWDNIIILFMR
jgi:hypothetical protein